MRRQPNNIVFISLLQLTYHLKIVDLLQVFYLYNESVFGSINLCQAEKHELSETLKMNNNKLIDVSTC